MPTLCSHRQCTGCAACANSCPKNCITMRRDPEGFLRPTIDSTHCIHCNKCEQSCPLMIPPKHLNTETKAYAAIHGDPQIRLASTSGGVFSLLCEWVLAQGGAIFGATYDDTFSVIHHKITRRSDLDRLRTAKYAQSVIDHTYREAQQLLIQGQYVLFSGTPCQIAGLTSFLKKNYENLILVDLICHGVPSPAVWAYYVAYRSQRDNNGAAPTSINMRCKNTGWPQYSVCFNYNNEFHYTASNTQDPFLRCFIANLCLRPSCYNCAYKGTSRISDFTLGDYWGVWNQLPEYHDEQGTSLVLLHTEKAHKIWETLSPLHYQEVDIDKALEENPSALVSSNLPHHREYFMTHYANDDFQKLVDKLLPKPKTLPFWRQVLPFLRRARRRLLRL